eukprot:1070007-Rhodomonas_salina.1
MKTTENRACRAAPRSDITDSDAAQHSVRGEEFAVVAFVDALAAELPEQISVGQAHVDLCAAVPNLL